MLFPRNVSIAKNRSHATCLELSLSDVALFFALSVHQRVANGSKRRHKAKAEDRCADSVTL
jgi:hypothetical protein